MKRSLAMLVVAVVGSVVVSTQAVAGPPGSPDTLTPPTVDGGVISVFEVSPTGEHVVYWGDPETDGVFDLFSVPVAGGPAVRLSDPAVGATRPSGTWAISEDGRWVVFSASSGAPLQLFATPIEGGETVRLSRDLSAGEALGSFTISPTSDTVLYGVFASGRTQALYAVPISGGSSTQVNAAMANPGGGLSGWAASPDGARVVYGADANIDGVFQLFSASIAGGPAATLTDTSGDPSLIGFADDRAIFEFTVTGVTNLRSVALTGGPAVTLNQALPDGGSVVASALTDDGAGVLYVADASVDETFALWSVPAAGGAPVALTDGIDTPVGLTTAGPTAVYLGAEADRWFGVPVNGSRSPLPLTESGAAAPGTATLTPDGERLVYVSADQQDIVSVSVADATATSLIAASFDGGSVLFTPAVSADSRRGVAMVEQPDGDGTRYSLVSVPVGGGEPTILEERSTTTGLPWFPSVSITADSTMVVYANSDPEASGSITELYVVDIGVPCGDGFASIFGTDGPDVIVGTDGDDIIVGLGGRDEIRGGAGDDIICGNGGHDNIRGGSGDDVIFGAKGRDRIRGGGGDDIIDGGSSADRIDGNGGRDTIYGRRGADAIKGNGGADRIFGNGGPDRLLGGRGADVVEGGGSDDELLGGSRGDTLKGGPGNDAMDGGAGVDTCRGGGGVNTAVSCEVLSISRSGR